MALKKAQVKAEQPTGQEVEIGTVVTTPPQLLAKNSAPAQSSPPPATRLPQTASTLPLVAMLGLVLTGAGFLLRFVARNPG